MGYAEGNTHGYTPEDYEADLKEQEEMRVRLIDGNSLKQMLREEIVDNPTEYEDGYNGGLEVAIELATSLPEAVRVCPTAEWIEVDDGLVSGRCSLCGWEAVIMETDVCGMPFCPNCGASMSGGDGDGL